MSHSEPEVLLKTTSNKIQQKKHIFVFLQATKNLITKLPSSIKGNLCLLSRFYFVV